MKIVDQNIVLTHQEVKGYDWGRPFTKAFPTARFINGQWLVPVDHHTLNEMQRLTDVELVHEKPDPIDMGVFLTRPFKHQLDALTKCNKANSFAYFLEPGLGKTKTLIDDVTILYEEGRLNNVLIICPKSVISTWGREIRKHSKYKIISKIYEWPNYPIKIDSDLSWFIINPDAIVCNELAMAECEEFIWSYDNSMVVIDESTMIANPQAKRTKKIYQLGGMAQYRRILTGDPIANTPLDLFSQLKWLNPRCLKHKNIYSFRHRYCIMGGFKGKEVIGYQRQDELRNIMDSVGIRTRTSDVMDLPPQTWMEPIRVEPDASTSKLYDKIVEEEIMSLFDNPEIEVSAALAITKMTKLLQVCGGTLIDDEKNIYEVGHEKLKELQRMLEDWGSVQVLIWCHYSAEIKILYRELSKKYSVGMYTGNMDKDERQTEELGFENGDTQILILQDDTGHLGLTLNAASHVIFYSNHMRPIVRNQAERRNWRIGQTKPVFYYDILMNGLIDCKVYKSLMEKRSINDYITDGISRETMRKICYE